MKKYFSPIIIIIIFACKEDVELAMERGIQYYEWEKIEKAILEFKYVIHFLSKETNNSNYKHIQLLSRAHHNLAIAYAKKTWYNEAVLEAQQAFELIPTDDNRKVIQLIQKKIRSKSKISTKEKPSSQ